mgnify:CR=1 FL=1
MEPKVLLLDEPCSALDVKASAKIEELLKNLKERYTIVIVPHNLAQAKRIADDVAFFQNGRLVETKDAETFWKPECEETKEFLKDEFYPFCSVLRMDGNQMAGVNTEIPVICLSVVFSTIWGRLDRISVESPSIR